MDTNISQALKMAGGILIALIIISTLSYFFKSLIPVQKQIDEIEELEQTAEFNKQYEVYNKSLMLGIDIISVINKAYSNNMAYIDAYGYSQDIKDNYLIDIIIDTPVTMQQTLIVKDVYDEVNGIINENEPVIIDVLTLSSTSKNQIKDKLGLENIDTKYSDVTIQGNLIQKDATYDTDGNPLTPEEKIYIDTDMYEYIIKDSVNDLKRNARNNDSTTIAEWGVATLETYAYSLKNKKFTCTSVINSPQTGRVISMIFREIQ